MSNYVITTDKGLQSLFNLLSERQQPFCVEVTSGLTRHRTLAQNRLQHAWVKEIADQLGDHTPEEIRGMCKLTMGVPILRNGDTKVSVKFREQYDAIIKPLPYEDKMSLMMEPIDFPITRIMSTKQMTEYLDTVYRYWTEKGLILTQPVDDRFGPPVGESA